MRTTFDDSKLDNSAWHSLVGPHAGLSRRAGAAARYLPDVSPLAAVSGDNPEASWRDLLSLVATPEIVVVFGPRALGGAAPPGWVIVDELVGVQMVATERLATAVDPLAVSLGAADVPDMLDLVAATRPGPFLPATHRLGGYRGIRLDGRLVAMGGERLRPPGWTEISAICTDPEYRGRGLASRLVATLAHSILERGDAPFLHAASSNVSAIRLYESLGFEVRRETFFAVLTPAG